MFCIKCGKTLDPSATVCPECGTAVVIPDGFDLHAETNTQQDNELLGSEKTVAADYGVIARKAAQAVNASSFAETEVTEPVRVAGPVMQDSVPHSPAGFNLKNVKKTMNGRSILIDDSPLPGSLPAYLAPPVQAVQPIVPSVSYAAPTPAAAEEKTQNSKAVIIAVVAAVVVVALVAGVLFFVFSNKNKNEDSVDSAQKTSVSEEMTKDKSEKLDKEDFVYDETKGDTLVNSYTDFYIDGGADKGDDEITVTETETVNRQPGIKPAVPVSPGRPNDFIAGNQSEQDLSDILYGETVTAETSDEVNSETSP